MACKTMRASASSQLWLVKAGLRSCMLVSLCCTQLGYESLAKLSTGSSLRLILKTPSFLGHQKVSSRDRHTAAQPPSVLSNLVYVFSKPFI